MSGKIKKSQTAKATASSDDAPSRIVIGTGKSEAAAATNSNGGGESFIRDLPPPSQMVQPRGAALALLSGNLSAAMPSTADSDQAKNNSTSGNRFANFSQLEQPLPMMHSYSLPSLPSTLLQPRMTSSVEVDEGEGASNDSSNISRANRDLSSGDHHYPPTTPLPLLSRTLSTPESSSSSRSVFGRAGSAFGRFSTAGSRANAYTQSDPGLSAFHPVSFSHQRSFGSGGSSSLVGSEIIEEHDDGSGLKSSARASTVPSNKKTRGFLMKAREKLETTKLQSTKRRSGRENPARPSLNDTDDVSPPTTIITNNDDGVEISIVTEGKTVPPKIERVSPSKIKASKSSKKGSLVKTSIIPHVGEHDDPGLELNFTDDSEDDDESIDEVEGKPSVEVSLKPQSNRPPSRASNISQMPFNENVQTYTHTATNVKTSAAGVAAKFKFKSPQRRSKMMNSPSSYIASASPHQSPSAGTTSSSSNGSPDSRGGLSTISSNSNSISSAANTRNKINSAASSPGGTDSCAKESMGSSTTNSEVRDIVRQNQKKNIRNLRSAGKDGQPEEFETASVDMDIISASADSGNSVCMREGAINPHIALSHIPGGTPSVSPHRLPESVHEAPFDERSRGSPEVGKIIDSKVSKIITSKRESQSPHSADAHTTSSASASNASVSNATSTSSGGGSQQPVKFVAYERVEEREESPFDEHPHDESRIATPQNVIRPTITNGGNSALGQRPPTSPRKTMGRMTTPPPHVHTTLAGFKTPASPPTIADRHIVVRDMGVVESGSRSHIPKPKSNRMKMILVNPSVVSPERLHSQANVAIDSRQRGGSELNAAIVSPEKAS